MRRVAIFAVAAVILGGYAMTRFGAHNQATAAVAAAPESSADASGQQASAPPDVAPVLDNPGFYAGEAGLSPSARAGREIWYKATAGNSRFHTYTFQQRVGVLIDWYRVLNSQERSDRFAAWGIINDPGCCTPGSEGCPAKTRILRWLAADHQRTRGMIVSSNEDP